MKKILTTLSIVFFAVIVFSTLAQAGGAFIWIDAPSGGAGTGTWETVWTDDNNFASYGAAEYTWRQVITSALMASGGPWTKIRITFDGCSSPGDDINVSVCIQDTAANCTATPTTITVSSSATWTQGTSDILSDEITFSWSDTDNILVNVHADGGDECYWYEGGFTNYYTSGDTTADTTASGSTDTYRDYLWKIEGWNPD